MECCRRNYFSASWNLMFTWLIVVILGVDTEVAGEGNCPVQSGMLYAFTEGETYRFDYTFDPLFRLLAKNVDPPDRFLSSDDDVRCAWVVTTKPDHTAFIRIEDFNLTPPSGTKDGDCLKFYDGQMAKDKLLGELCGGDKPPQNYTARGRYLHVIFTQGEVTGRRYFNLFYKAEAEPEEPALKILGFVFGLLAAVLAAIGLVFKFTHNCRLCHEYCFSDKPVEEGMSHRELRPLSPAVLVPPRVSRARRGNRRNEQRVMAHAGNTPASAGQRQHRQSRGFTQPQEEEPPPSYDSIFGPVEQIAT